MNRCVVWFLDVVVSFVSYTVIKSGCIVYASCLNSLYLLVMLLILFIVVFICHLFGLLCVNACMVLHVCESCLY